MAHSGIYFLGHIRSQFLHDGSTLMHPLHGDVRINIRAPDKVRRPFQVTRIVLCNHLLADQAAAECNKASISCRMPGYIFRRKACPLREAEKNNFHFWDTTLIQNFNTMLSPVAYRQEEIKKEYGYKD